LTKRVVEERPTHFLNVDLDVWSRTPLDPIVDAFGDRVFVLHVGKWRRRYSAHCELAGYRKNPSADLLIVRLVQLVKRLPKPLRQLWNSAYAREFNIGIEAARKSSVFELRLRPETLSEVAAIGGRIVVTVYAPERIVRNARRRRKKSAA
jgi:hypothetical protein